MTLRVFVRMRLVFFDFDGIGIPCLVYLRTFFVNKLSLRVNSHERLQSVSQDKKTRRIRTKKCNVTALYSIFAPSSFNSLSPFNLWRERIKIIHIFKFCQYIFFFQFGINCFSKKTVFRERIKIIHIHISFCQYLFSVRY